MSTQNKFNKNNNNSISKEEEQQKQEWEEEDRQAKTKEHVLQRTQSFQEAMQKPVSSHVDKLDVKKNLDFLCSCKAFSLIFS